MKTHRLKKKVVAAVEPMDNELLKTINYKQMNYKITYILILVMIGSLSCNSKIEPYENIDAMLADANKTVEYIDIEDFKTNFDNKEHYVIIDCREEKEFVAGHIPGAINVPRGLIGFAKTISDRHPQLYIYSLTKQRATLGAAELKKLKYKHVSVITGGWEKWHKNFPELIEKGSGTKHTEATEPEEESGGCG